MSLDGLIKVSLRGMLAIESQPSGKHSGKCPLKSAFERGADVRASAALSGNHHAVSLEKDPERRSFRSGQQLPVSSSRTGSERALRGDRAALGIPTGQG